MWCSSTFSALLLGNASWRWHDDLADRFGTNVVHRANDLNKAPGTRLASTLDFLDDRELD
jgi:hypothetical protein